MVERVAPDERSRFPGRGESGLSRAQPAAIPNAIRCAGGAEMVPRNGRTRFSGFTLIEVLVALAIFAVALAASVRAASISTDGALEVRERMLATWVAQNHLAELSAVGAFPEVGGRGGEAEQGGIRFKWEETVSGTPNQSFRRVEIRVSTSRKPDYIVARLVGHARRTQQ